MLIRKTANRAALLVWSRGIRSPGGERAVLRGARRGDAARRQHGSARLIGAWLCPGPGPDREPDQPGHAR